MLIGIDMIAVQSPEGGDRLAGRFARWLATALLDGDPANRYVLYLHEGMGTQQVPTRRGVSRVTLAPVAARRGPARRRLAVQRVIDRNPDGLDWLLLLDPFEDHYGGPPPEAGVGGLKVASVVVNLANDVADDRAIRTLGRHDMILAVGDTVAATARHRLGGTRTRIRTIEPATTPRVATAATQAMTLNAARALGDRGITGRFVLADASGGLSRPDLFGVLDAFADLPVRLRSTHQLVVVGQVADPDPVRRRLDARGCHDRLVLTGSVGPDEVETLLDRCTAYLSPAVERDAPQALVEAMGRGAAIVAGPSDSDDVAVGDAALRVEPTELAARLAGLLSDPDLKRDLQARSLARAGAFPWETTVESIVSALDEVPAAELGRNRRVDRPHLPRPRVALFPSLPQSRLRRVDLNDCVPAGLATACAVDLYLDAADFDRVAGLPVDLGGFDARLFGRNDAVLRYAAVVHQAATPADLAPLLPALRQRPGVVHLLGSAWDEIETEADLGALDAALATRARLIVDGPWLAWDLRARFPHRADQIVSVPLDDATEAGVDRAEARERLNLAADATVIGRVCPGADPDPGASLSILHAFKDLARTRPDVVLALVTLGEVETDFDPDADLVALAAQLGIGDRVVRVAAADRSARQTALAALDLAFVPASSGGGSAVVHLLRADVPTVVLGEGVATIPAAAVRRVTPTGDGPGLVDTVRDLATDPRARLALVRTARRACLDADPHLAPARSWAALLAGPDGDSTHTPGPRERTVSPHFPRAVASASATTPHPAMAPRPR